MTADGSHPSVPPSSEIMAAEQPRKRPKPSSNGDDKAAEQPQKRLKQNSDGDTKAAGTIPGIVPTVFYSLGANPDVRLKVLKAEFHAHSTILKHHSRLFRESFDLPNTYEISATSPFKYEFGTVVDSNGLWTLKREGESEPLSEKMLALVKNFHIESSVFGCLLGVMYTHPITLPQLDHLRSITRIATFCGALPCLSAVLTAVLFQSSMFKRSPELIYSQSPVQMCSRDVIIFAWQLRHSGLFRECFIHMVATWMHPRFKDKDTWFMSQYPRVCLLIWREHSAILKKLAFVQGILLRPQYIPVVQYLGPSEHSPETKTCDYMAKLKLFIMKNYRDRFIVELGGFVLEEIGELLVNNLTFEREYYNPEGIGIQNFLCANIKDDEMPWDRTRTDW